MDQGNREKMREEIYQRLKLVLTNMLKIMQEKKPENRPKLEWSTDLIKDLGVDSLESMDLMNAIEEEFQVSPNLNEANSRTTISQIVDYILELVDQKSMRS